MRFSAVAVSPGQAPIERLADAQPPFVARLVTCLARQLRLTQSDRGGTKAMRGEMPERSGENSIVGGTHVAVVVGGARRTLASECARNRRMGDRTCGGKT